ncbi:MAG: hypothetical protein COB15_08080 [Flavobacteriales bacterium]|nr:MAG: hypothetical protein COB15_08080 [Flavobacteriales bacterium]
MYRLLIKTYISLLRGINVSGQKKIKMLNLVALFNNYSFVKVLLNALIKK